MKKNNGENFLVDLKKVREVMVYAAGTSDFFEVKKKDVKQMASTRKINYYMTDKIFVVRRPTMVIT